MAACSSDAVVDKMVDLPEHGWEAVQPVSIPFEIMDKNNAFRVYYSGRYDNSYPYYNLYLSWQFKDSSGKVIASSKQDKPSGMNLFDPQSGIPTGRGMAGKKDFLILDTSVVPVFPYNGPYTMELKQYMRADTLVGISSVGIRIEAISKAP
jgi:gliding motility-associated lipoprotein GldH